MLATKLEQRSFVAGRLGRYWLGFTLLALLYLLLATLAALKWGDPERLERPLTLLLFLGLLPLANAPLDWLSVGITRGLLTQIKNDAHTGWRALCWALADLLIAGLFFAAVAATTFAVISAVNWAAALLGAAPVLDVKSMVRQFLGEHWPDGLWLWLMLLSTLIPTALHFVVALLAALQTLFNGMIASTVGQLQDARQRYQDRPDASHPHEVHTGARLRAVAVLWAPRLLLIAAVLPPGSWLLDALPGWADAGLQWLHDWSGMPAQV